METTGIIGYILGFYRDNGKENGNYRDYTLGIQKTKEGHM